MPGSVMITYAHTHTVSHSFCYSLVRSLAHPEVHSVFPTRGFPALSLVAARNEAVAHFLDSDAEWLWTLDTDMGFQVETLPRLMRHGDAYGVISGLYYAQREIGDDGAGAPMRCEPLPLAMKRAGDSFHVYPDYSEPMEVDAVGAGCLLVHREVFNAIGDSGWYDLHDGLGEDFSFCTRVADAGYMILCDPTIRLTHHKQIWLSNN